MKKKIYLITSLCLACVFFMSHIATAQQSDAYSIPLTRPGETGTLKVHIIDGSITVNGYDGDVVKVTAVGRGSKKGQQRSKKGLKRIDDNSLSFSVEERDNNVYVSKTPNGSSNMSFEIQVPKNFSVDLKTVNNGTIKVNNVDGTHETSNLNGKISMTNVGGSVVADALNQDITVSFRRITPNTTMMFTSLNGDLDVSFPASLKATVSAMSEFGSVYTDFEIALDKSHQKRETTSKNGVYKVVNKKGVYGSINGGGADITFKTMNGDVFIRSN